MPRDLADLGLTDEAKLERLKYLGGSDANIIASGDQDAIMNLWKVKTGQVEDEDLSDVLPVMLGQFTEPFNVMWYEKTTGRKVTDEQQRAYHNDYKFMSSTLDGRTTTASGKPAVFEAKHVNAFTSVEDQVQKYMAQLHHNMATTGLEHAVLSMIRGNMGFEVYEVECDFWYMSTLIDAELEFWRCVEENEPPFIDPIERPIKEGELREVDMSKNNAWCALAADYIELQQNAKDFEKAKKDMKALVEKDVGRAFGAGLQIKRAKNGNLNFSNFKTKEDK